MNRSVGIAVTIFALLTLWMVSGLILPGSQPEAEEEERPPRPAAQVDEAKGQAVRVRVAESVAETVERLVRFSGQTQPDRGVRVVSEIAAEVVELGTPRGEAIEEGDLIVGLEVRDRQTRTAFLRSLVRQRELELEAQRNLLNDGLASVSAIAAGEAALDEARSDLEDAELALEKAQVVAPFSGRLLERQVEMGEFVQRGSTVAFVIDLDPIVVTGNVSEREVLQLSLGQPARLQLPGGIEVSGSVRFISAVGDPASRTFAVEVAAANPEELLPAGITVDVEIPVDSVPAHYFSASLLSLADNGDVGIRVVDTESRVRFLPVTIERADRNGIWVTGLPEVISVIKVGQAFVQDGQRVEARPVEDEEADSQKS